MTLTALFLKTAPDGRHGDDNGLAIYKKGKGGKWIYRYSHLGQRREMGLGSYPDVSLAEARRSRDEWKAELRKGNDPISVRDAARAAQKAERDKRDPTLTELAAIAYEVHRRNLKNNGAGTRWLSPLENHVLPKIGKMRASQIHQSDLHRALSPIWHSKAETASKAIQRLAIIFRHGKHMGFNISAETVESAKYMLGPQNAEKKNIAATPWQDIPALYSRLSDSPASMCLRFMILTAVRSNSCRGARFDEIEGNVWTVPASRMKGDYGAFRVPLTPEAMSIIEERRKYGGDLPFSENQRTPLTDVSLHKKLNKLNEKGRPHGFRTSFRTWAQDQDISREVAERILAHKFGGKVEQAYARSDLLERRSAVMQSWADFVTQSQGSSVVPIKA